MSNAGTWLVGRLQTEKDKRRILEGLAAASGKVDIGAIDKQITDLAKRQFVLHSTKSSEPRIFYTRWAMSYLAGPLTRDQGEDPHGGEASRSAGAASLGRGQLRNPFQRPLGRHAARSGVADGIRVSYLHPATPWATKVGADPTGNIHEPAVAATVQLLYDETRAGLDHRETYEAVVFPIDGGLDADTVVAVDHDPRDFQDSEPPAAAYRAPGAAIATKSYWKGMETELRDHLVAHRPLHIWANPDLKIYSRVDESEDDFRDRCRIAAEEAADAEVAKLQSRYQSKIDRVEDEMAKAQARSREANAVAAAKSEETLLGTAGDLLGAFLGGRSSATVLDRAARRRSAAAKAGAKADTEADRYHLKHAELEELEDELAAEVEEIVATHLTLTDKVESLEVSLEKDDVRVAELQLVWVPVE
ncbi:MAG TPA: hypothetical protein VMM14_00605 [Acidimicrobiia bacterium]|nr:hypothetical protein [Acidimicrobiia bacterium]